MSKEMISEMVTILGIRKVTVPGTHLVRMLSTIHCTRHRYDQVFTEHRKSTKRMSKDMASFHHAKVEIERNH